MPDVRQLICLTMKKSSLFMLLTGAGIALGIAFQSQGCKGNHHVNHISTECAVFEGYPIIHAKEFETWAVFVPVDQLNNYGVGSNVWIDSNGFIVDPLIRDAETMQPVTEGLDHVILHERILPNKFELIK